MSLSILFDGIQLNNEAGPGPWLVDGGSSAIDWGSEAVASVLLNPWTRPEQFDQIAEENALTRQVVIPLQLRGGSSDGMITNQQALLASLSAANWFTPKTLTVVLPGSSHTSTLHVCGGAWNAAHDDLANRNYLLRGTLTLLCDWPVYGPVQTGGALGSSGSPLISNTPSPAAVTLAPATPGDIPGDVTLFVKNRSASAIRSLIAGCVAGNTSWVAGVNQSAWTLDADGSRFHSRVYSVSQLQDVIGQVAHFTAPTLPSDRRFRLLLAAGHNLNDGAIYFRVRLVCGSVEVVGEWMSLPQEISDAGTGAGGELIPEQAVDMGAWVFPPGEVGQLGAQATTIYIEALQPVPLVFGDVVQFREALFMPDDSMIVVETPDTSVTLAAAAGVTRLESDSTYDNSGNPAGAPVVGSHIRSMGGRYVVYTSQGFTDTLDPSLGWKPENVDVWFTYTPRYLALA